MEIISVPPLPKTTDPEIVSLRAHVKAAEEEFDQAVQYHEMWKPAAYDAGLHQRVSRSYAANGLLIVRAALRRETLLALMRLWDKDSRAVRMEEIAKILKGKKIIDALAADRASRFRDVHIEAEIKQDMTRKAKEATDLIDAYSKSGCNEAVLEKLRTMRHERLAHRQITLTAVTGPGLTDKEIESLYQDNAKLIGLLLSVVSGIGSDPQQTAEVIRDYASFFWAGVRGEKTEGHPNYRAAAT
jgi:hypothetical protein